MELQEATSEEEDFVYELCKSSLKKYFDEVEEGWSDEKFHRDYNPNRIKIIMLEKERAGYVEYVIEDSIMHWHNLHLKPGVRGKGLGSRVVNHLKSLADEISGKVFRKNDESRSFLKKNGFSEEKYIASEDSYIIRWKRNN